MFDRNRIVVADEESVAVAFIIHTLRRDSHCVTHALDALSGTLDIMLYDCQILISGTKVDGVARIDLIDELRERLPHLATEPGTEHALKCEFAEVYRRSNSCTSLTGQWLQARSS